MRLTESPPIDLTYCLNVHPGETWTENFLAIRTHAVLAIRSRVAPGKRFGLGLRLSNTAAVRLATPRVLEGFRRFLADQDMYVFTVNGFPYGTFHGTSVKQNVYRPDWRTPERRDYTIALADILARLLPRDTVGSISTVPGSYKGWIRSEEDLQAMVEMLADVAAHLEGLRESTGKEICLALEPEPDCYLENTSDTISFINNPLTWAGGMHLHQRHGVDLEEARPILRRHIGVCFDTAHLAVQFEDLADSIERLQAEDIRIAKIHLSAAIRLSPTPEALSQLAQFSEGVYLHQVKVRTAEGKIDSYDDLPAALDAARSGTCTDEEWRVHFHVPLFFAESGGLQSTASLFTPAFAALLAGGVAPHVEIETYTFNVLPEMLAVTDITDGIAREYEWTLGHVFTNR